MVDARDFLAALGHERITAQVFPDSPSAPPYPRVLHGPLPTLERKLRRFNAEGYGVFFCVNRTDLRGREEKNVLEVMAYFADFDGVPVPHDIDNLLPPTAIVESSPEKYHVYWRVTGAPLKMFSHVQDHIAVMLGSDRKVKDLPRVMRLPGFLHKKAEPFETRVTFLDASRVYTHSDVMVALAPPEFVETKPRPPAADRLIRMKREKGRSMKTAVNRIAGAPDGQRNHTLFRVASAIANDVKWGKVDEAEAKELLAQAAQQSGLSQREAEKTIASAMRYAK